ncbi:probable membrane-associated kinase regulator 4 [Cornus florida]|uniref:probable membrane-associated kinase regulator 4 n=1 Tax=Cornus florida TaxID=4283 RepID=UPI0028A17B7D|nr:probable membrane-associated kinase regulator 4 [Cornus florida]
MLYPSSPFTKPSFPNHKNLRRHREREKHTNTQMAVNLSSSDHVDEDYIDMEISSYSQFYCQSMSSPPHPREFEFQMFSSSSERETTTSPADELFYKGKLLPLHLPPRLQMVEKLLQASTSYDHKKDDFEEFFSTPLTTTTTNTPTNNTPFESCNISPSESCQVSRELNPYEYLFEYSTEASGFIGDNPKKSWTRKLKLIKKSSLGSKLKASGAYFKSFFSKSGCSDESCTSAARNLDEESVLNTKEFLNKDMNMTKKAPFGQIQKDTYQMPITVTRSFNKEQIAADGRGRHRRSFSGAIKRLSTVKSSSSSSSSGSSSSSSSSNSNEFHELQFFKRSGSVKSDIENSIQGAIAHCKRSQQQPHLRKTASEVGFYSLSASKIVCEDQERPGLCRG